MAELQPPRKSVELEDDGARELESSEGEEHFSDASEGKMSSETSPVPITRVERVDDKPSHGEVPGTEAYKIRTQDAVPDEVEVVPEGTRSRSSSRVSSSGKSRSPGGTSIPRTVVEKVDDTPSHGEVPGTYAHELRKADAEPDEIIKSPEKEGASFKGSPTNSINRSRSPSEPLRTAPLIPSPTIEIRADVEDDAVVEDKGGDDEDGFGDDFDEFEAGAEQEDFGEFDEGFEQPSLDRGDAGADSASQYPVTPQPYPFPILNYDEFENAEEMHSAMAPYLENMFPDAPMAESRTTTLPPANSIFTTERSTALWAQLVEPPPLQPPNWIRSRIRRMFLVSLGVPVDLDEILPASKQKKLVLPSINLSPRPSSERANGAIERVKRQNDSSTSVNSTSSKAERKRRGPPPPPDFDIAAATRLSSTTDVALKNLADEELKAHMKQLRQVNTRASEVLEYWLKRKDSAVGDKEAFEAVIENLVKHARKVR
ncbi:hypothetical protein EV356DRAFT_524936 [Viridothelium virens]|uniref:Uncharacterized protein n=1 Tax=Viridothelium virens TaxID=1048519 RepID=A0A6A6H4Z4_VIRVR|nr:hypothetical protein EV356DRAFT_524936 [Viridothelium virens]